MNDLCPLPGCCVEQVIADSPSLLDIAAHGLGRGSYCPDRGRKSVLYTAGMIGILPICLRLDARFWFGCACAGSIAALQPVLRQTFAERLPNLIAPFARRTHRLAEAQGRAGAALGGETSTRLLSRLSMPASADTVLRLVKRMPLPDQAAPRVVGVDDWAEWPKVPRAGAWKGRGGQA